jgi:hypothetical protein
VLDLSALFAALVAGAERERSTQLFLAPEGVVIS